MRELESALRGGLADLALVLEDRQVALLLDYLALIQKWTQVYNLTAVRDPTEMLTHHLLDSLAVIPPLRRQLADLPAPLRGMDAVQLRLLDVGSGAGLPGVVIAICCPEITVDCVDAVAKKVAFIRHVAATLQLPNLQGLHARVESLTHPYRIICSRAFASLADFTRLSKIALAPQGLWLAMKAKAPDAEIADVPPQVEVFHVEQLRVPGLGAERCIVWMRAAAT